MEAVVQAQQAENNEARTAPHQLSCDIQAAGREAGQRRPGTHTFIQSSTDRERQALEEQSVASISRVPGTCSLAENIFYFYLYKSYYLYNIIYKLYLFYYIKYNVFF